MVKNARLQDIGWCSMGGWIKLHRQITESDLWDDKPFSKGQAWIDLLLLANYEDRQLIFETSIFNVKRGEFVTSIVILSNRWGWSRCKVSNFLNVLEKAHQIEQQRDNKKTWIKIVNYSVYQDTPTADCTAKKQQIEHQKSTNKEVKKKEEKKKGFTLVEQHDYDFDELERKLLKSEG